TPRRAAARELASSRFADARICFITSSGIWGSATRFPLRGLRRHPRVAFRQDLGCGERYAIGRGVRRRCHRGPLTDQELDAHEEGKVFVHRVVAVVDVGAAVLAELDLELDLATGA